MAQWRDRVGAGEGRDLDFSENVPLKVTDTGWDVPQLLPTRFNGSESGSTEVTRTLNSAVAVTARV